LRRVNEVLNEQPTIIDDADTKPFLIDRGEIEIRNLSFQYAVHDNRTNGSFSLEDITLHVPAGTTIAIVGHTGSGKTTLVNLIARVLELESGEIFIDGTDITTIPLSELRKKVAVVPQDSFLFSTTLRENIAFGLRNGDGIDVETAARTAGLMPDIKTFPKGFDTMIGERGINLSGGQRQRTALARALVSDPRILILDDAFASVDTDTEEQILDNLKNMLRNRTAILISHRISTVRDADKIVVLDEGRIAEEGTHDALLEKGGLYADLYQKQMLLDELNYLR
jgi:ATP-binding cassette subfamily B protein